MCITTAFANLAKTKEFAGILPNENHFLTYANQAKSLIKDWNSMPIPIPTSDYENIIFHDSRSYGKELEKIANTFHEETRSIGVSKGIQLEYVGNYAMIKGHVSLIRNMCNLADVEISTELEQFYIRNYEGWSLVLACWKGSIDVKYEPIHIEYKPDLYPTELFVYMMDAHGEVPTNNNRDVDHIICLSIPGVSSGLVDYFTKRPNFLKYSDELLSVIPNMNTDLFGIELEDKLQNGDFWINLKSFVDFVTVKDIVHGKGSKIIFKPSIGCPNEY